MPKIYQRNCNNCGKYYKGYGIYFCSRDCGKKGQRHAGFPKGHIPYNKDTKGIAKANSGSFKKGYDVTKHWNWQGGINPESMKIRRSVETLLWRKSVFTRDNFTCQKYGIRGGELVAHHINNFADFPELRFAIDNGVTLSEKAHIEFHKKYGWKNNTREQLEEFLKGRVK